MNPKITRGTIATNIAHMLPLLVPKTGIAGEKANDNKVGEIVLITILVSPNMSPRKDPIFGPKIIAATMTGIWMIVALITPKWIKPNGVNAANKIIETKIAVKVKFFIFIL